MKITLKNGMMAVVDFGRKVGKAVVKKSKAIVVAVVGGGALVAMKAEAVIDTAALDLIKTDAEAWLTYAVGAAVAIMLVGLAYHGARLAYNKMKGGMKAG